MKIGNRPRAVSRPEEVSLLAPSCQNGQETISYRVVRSTRRRKTCAISLSSAGEVIARVPAALSDEDVGRLIAGHAAWIERKRREMRAQGDIQAQNRLALGEIPEGEGFGEDRILFYQGKPHALHLQRGHRFSVSVRPGYLVVTHPGKAVRPAALQGAVLEWYRGQALARLTEQVHRHAPLLGVTPQRISVKDQKTRWGSCSRKGNLNFNWRLVMAPPEILEYVVVHELCHLKVPNHSAEFWAEVASLLPDYRERRGWLRQRGKALMAGFVS